MNERQAIKKLGEIGAQIRDLEDQLQPLYARRNKIIRDAPLSIRKAALAAGVTPGRVQQIRR